MKGLGTTSRPFTRATTGVSISKSVGINFQEGRKRGAPSTGEICKSTALGGAAMAVKTSKINFTSLGSGIYTRSPFLPTAFITAVYFRDGERTFPTTAKAFCKTFISSGTSGPRVKPLFSRCCIGVTAGPLPDAKRAKGGLGSAAT